MCTICNETAQCSAHRTWERKYGDDIREMQRQLRDGEIDFALVEMAS